MTNLEIARKNFDRGLWTDDMVGKLVKKGRLTAGDYKAVTGAEYTGEVTSIAAAELDAAYREGVQNA